MKTKIIGIVNLKGGWTIETVPVEVEAEVCIRKEAPKMPDWSPVLLETKNGMFYLPTDKIESLSYREVENG